MRQWYFVGVDLGQRADPTAIAVVQRAELVGEWDPVQFAYRKVVEHRLRHLEVMRLGTPYPDVVERVKEVANATELARRVTVVADATGAGTPVVDIMMQAGMGCQVVPVILTGGDLQRRDKNYYMVPKRDLMAGLILRLEQGELKIADDLKEGERLLREMAEMRVRVTPSGREQYGARGAGEHDDLVLAVALACWGGRQFCADGGRGSDAYVCRAGVRGWERETREAVRRLL